MKTIPDKWVILKITRKEETLYRVFASWAGGYLTGDSWRVNSGISDIYLEGDNYRIGGFSGSHYICHKDNYGVIGGYNQGVLSNILEKQEKDVIEVLPKTTEFLKLIKK